MTMLAQIGLAQRAGMAPRQEELGRWFAEVKRSEDAQGSREQVGHLLAWLGERRAEYGSYFTSSARRNRRDPSAQQQCRETDDPVRQPGVDGIWNSGHGRSEPCGTI
jgi:hypothetical protein